MAADVLTIFFGGMLAFASIASIIIGIVDVRVVVRDLPRGPQIQETSTSMFLRYLYQMLGNEEPLGPIHEAKLMPTIPRCASNCIYPRILKTGCASKDYQCFCRNLHDALDDEDVDDIYNWVSTNKESAKTCVENCYIVDRVVTPERIQELCRDMNVEVVMPQWLIKGRDLLPRQEDFSSFYSTYIPFVSATLISSPIMTSNIAPTIISINSTPTPTTTPTAALTTPTTNAATTPGSLGAGGSSTVPTPTGESFGLSTGAKIGIGVSIPLAVLFLALGIFLFLRRRNHGGFKPFLRKNNNNTEQPEKEHIDFGHSEPVTTITELPPNDIENGFKSGPFLASPPPTYDARHLAEAGGSQIHEMNTSSATNRPHELTASPSTWQAISPTSKPSPSPVARKPVSSTTGTSSFPAPWSTASEPLYQSPMYLGPSSERMHPAGGEGENQEQAMEQAQLEAEIANVRAQRERIRQERELEERETELSKRLEGLKKKGRGT